MKLLFFLPILFLITIACVTPEPLMTNEELCGEWVDRELTYLFSQEGHHERLREGEVFYSGTYEVYGDKIIFLSSEGKKTVSDLILLREKNIKINAPLPGKVYLSTELTQKVDCS